jgi:dipeptidyl aminopeptidase/acylaminoacyl peptidase
LKGAQAKNLPIIVKPHGGPWVRDVWGFNPEVQFLANRGIGVLQVNFRGSTGYGKAFWEAGFKQWGRRMQDDITDGARWLIGQGIADPKRIGIYGASYGGYAVLAGLAFTPELYACRVDYMVKNNEGHGFANEENRFEFYRTMETFLGKHLGSKVENRAA